MNEYFDVLIIGSGAAGLTLALSLAGRCRVAILSKTALRSGSTVQAQGGIATVMGGEDSLESHIQDTLIAGDGLNDPTTVRFVVEHANAAITWLVDQGVSFNLTQGAQFHLTREGGHSHRRILHAADATGEAVAESLVRRVQQSSAVIFEDHLAINLISQQGRCSGAYVLSCRENLVKTLRAKFVVLATGGASKVYLYTTSSDCASGDGIAMASRAGAQISHMEFNQFHPTCLYHPQEQSFLISEAVRGEGGVLRLPDGERFMPKFDPRAELAPRDIVARAIDFEMKRLGIEWVYLDITHRSPEFIQQHFPHIYQRCLALGLDITREQIPVVPAAHYTCGGVVVDHYGRASLDGLYAIGEVSCTGLHGANRLASNSLLECIVYGRAAGEDILRRLATVAPPGLVPDWNEEQVVNSDEAVLVSHNWQEIRRIMWDYVGIVRTHKRLARAWRRVALLKAEIQEYYRSFRVTQDLIELRNLVLVAELIIAAAMARRENCGLHYNLDCCLSSSSSIGEDP